MLIYIVLSKECHLVCYYIYITEQYRRIKRGCGAGREARRKLKQSFLNTMEVTRFILCFGSITKLAHMHIVIKDEEMFGQKFYLQRRAHNAKENK